MTMRRPCVSAAIACSLAASLAATGSAASLTTLEGRRRRNRRRITGRRSLHAEQHAGTFIVASEESR
jgi:hypothetical protein